MPPSPGQPLTVAVPNVSEGRDRATIEALVGACEQPGVRVIDVHSDPDHHRSVLTLAGAPLAVQDALVDLAGECADRIDVRRHRGVHPRLGALDVAPIVALHDEDVPFASEVARGVAARIGEEVNLPVFLYGEVATDPARTRPRDFRREGLEGLAHLLDEGAIVPDAGPPRLHPSAGAVLVGVRPPLIAINVWLPDATLTEARAIAARVREDGGGLPGVRALGLWLPEAGMAQVSMNVEDHRRAPLHAVLRAVRAEAERLGVEAGDAELVGLVPRDAMRGPSPAAMGIAGFRPGQVLELRAAA
ncbi:glutamate formimidoyltransferase [Miltoncostaea marina]|uniref:glutamate formimidoyltransferase n=1 Tax=Miltoncostaea marina TaxID=2843215 RepID=UPI001C3E3AAD|nr:glutamate formimidoyltransferase [Miltoncostaea marina]